MLFAATLKEESFKEYHATNNFFSLHGGCRNERIKEKLIFGIQMKIIKSKDCHASRKKYM